MALHFADIINAIFDGVQVSVPPFTIRTAP